MLFRETYLRNFLAPATGGGNYRVGNPSPMPQTRFQLQKASLKTEGSPQPSCAKDMLAHVCTTMCFTRPEPGS